MRIVIAYILAHSWPSEGHVQKTQYYPRNNSFHLLPITDRANATGLSILSQDRQGQCTDKYLPSRESQNMEINEQDSPLIGTVNFAQTSHSSLTKHYCLSIPKEALCDARLLMKNSGDEPAHAGVLPPRFAFCGKLYMREDTLGKNCR